MTEVDTENKLIVTLPLGFESLEDFEQSANRVRWNSNRAIWCGIAVVCEGIREVSKGSKDDGRLTIALGALSVLFGSIGIKDSKERKLEAYQIREAVKLGAELIPNPVQLI